MVIKLVSVLGVTQAVLYCIFHYYVKHYVKYYVCYIADDGIHSFWYSCHHFGTVPAQMLSQTRQQAAKPTM